MTLFEERSDYDSNNFSPQYFPLNRILNLLVTHRTLTLAHQNGAHFVQDFLIEKGGE